MKRFPIRQISQALVLLLVLGFFGFCVWNSALLEPLPIQQGYILALTLCVTGIIAFAVGRISFALALGGAIFLALKFISVMKMRYLESPLMPADFVYFVRESLLETLQQYPDLYHLAIEVGIAGLLLSLLVWNLDVRFLSRLRRRQTRVLASIAGAATSVLALWWCMQPTGPFAPVYTGDPWHALQNNAPLTGFFAAIHHMQPTLPAMSDAAAAERNWAATTKDTASTNTMPDRYPDIIMVLEESTFDPSGFVGCSIPQCRPRLFQSDRFTRAHGPLRTHTFGGGTMVSEFAVFSGMPQDIFGPAGMYAPFVLAPRLRDSLPQLLRRLGYLTVAVYPTGGNFLNARNAYKAYGFDKFYDAHDLGLQIWRTSDAQIFAAAKKAYAKHMKPGQPVFMMILTLEQHDPHDVTPRQDLPAPFNQRLMPGLSEAQELNLSAYLARLRDSDEGMDLLEQDFLQRAQPTVILHFGDHQPSFSGLMRSMPRNVPPGLEPFKDELTYFMLKSNFDGPSPPAYPMLDIAYLPGRVLRVAGLPEDPYFSALSTLENRCAGLFEDCEDPTELKSYYAWIFEHLGVFE
jgi:phosphoglycerol transferase MdoB-like AlkP superfamily enzyme